MTPLYLCEGALWALAAWQVVRVARHLRGGVLGLSFWWIGVGLAVCALSRALCQGASLLSGSALGTDVVQLHPLWTGLDCAGWILVGIGVFRLRKAIESI